MREVKRHLEVRSGRLSFTPLHGMHMCVEIASSQAGPEVRALDGGPRSIPGGPSAVALGTVGLLFACVIVRSIV